MLRWLCPLVPLGFVQVVTEVQSFVMSDHSHSNFHPSEIIRIYHICIQKTTKRPSRIQALRTIKQKPQFDDDPPAEHLLQTGYIAAQEITFPDRLDENVIHFAKDILAVIPVRAY